MLEVQRKRVRGTPVSPSKHVYQNKRLTSSSVYASLHRLKSKSPVKRICRLVKIIENLKSSSIFSSSTKMTCVQFENWKTKTKEKSSSNIVTQLRYIIAQSRPLRSHSSQPSQHSQFPPSHPSSQLDAASPNCAFE